MEELNVKEQLKEFDEFEEMFATSGWKRFVKLNGEILENIKTNITLTTKQDPNEIFFMKGQAYRCNLVINFEEHMARARKDLHEHLEEGSNESINPLEQ